MAWWKGRSMGKRTILVGRFSTSCLHIKRSNSHQENPSMDRMEFENTKIRWIFWTSERHQKKIFRQRTLAGMDGKKQRRLVAPHDNVESHAAILRCDKRKTRFGFHS